MRLSGIITQNEMCERRVHIVITRKKNYYLRLSIFATMKMHDVPRSVPEIADLER